MKLHAVLFLSATCAFSAEITGRVVDASSGEALSKVQVRGCAPSAMETDGSGRFRIEAATGECALQIGAVGYRPLTVKLTVVEGQPQALDVGLHPDTLRQTETVQVVAAPFAGEEGSAVALAGNELRNLAGVLSDDPLRAVQSLPGVTSNDDFQSQYAVRGAAFRRTGIYLDGVLLHSPFHTVAGDANNPSLSVVEGEVLESATLHTAALPPAYGDRTAGALDFRTREGDRRNFGLRGTAGVSNAGLTAEGPLGKSGSWLAAARKSYLQYIIDRTADDNTLAFGFWDAQGKLAYSLGERHHFTLAVTDGHSGLDRTQGTRQFGLNTVVDGEYHFTMGTTAWRWSPTSRVSMTNRLGWMRERYRNLNPNRTAIGGGGYGEWLWNGEGTATLSPHLVLEFGGSARRIRDDGFYDRLLNPPAPSVPIERYRGTGVRSGGYLQQTWTPTERLQLVAGGRLDHHDVSGLSAATPYAAVAIGLWKAGRLHLNWGQSVQFPEMSHFYSIAGRTTLLPERATHAQAAIEQALGERTRIRAEFYNRQDRDLLFRPLYDPLVLNGRVFVPSAYPQWTNSLKGWSRGYQVFVQRRAANHLTGWVAYAYGRTELTDGVTRNQFVADYDQKHSIRTFASYRMRPTVNLSAKWIWGTGLPVPGYYVRTGANTFAISDRRNLTRLPDYQRADFRINKAFIRHWGQITLFAEVINLTNRDNLRFEDLNGYDSRTGVARLGFDTMLPVLPSAGIVVDF